MKQVFRSTVIGTLLVGLAVGLAVELARADESDHPAQAQVKATTDEVFAMLEREPAVRQDRARLYALVDGIVLPQFDFERMAQRVLGPALRKATDPQKAAFTEEFRKMLVRTYSTALAAYAGQKVKFLPTRVKPDGEHATVRTTIESEGPKPIPVQYDMYADAGKWKVYDVTIEGVSLVVTYRSSFANEVRVNGLDALVVRLQAKNREEGG